MKTLYLTVATIGYCIEWKRWDFWNVHKNLKRCLMYLTKIWKVSAKCIIKMAEWDSHRLIVMYARDLRKRIRGSGN